MILWLQFSDLKLLCRARADEPQLLIIQYLGSTRVYLASEN